jgi:hypothetical protein
MPTLLFECPRTRRAIDAGIYTDSGTLAAVRPVKLRLYCSHCRRTHDLPIRGARLSENRMPELSGWQDAPKAPSLTIAINALRISLLEQGLNKARN